MIKKVLGKFKILEEGIKLNTISTSPVQKLPHKSFPLSNIDEILLAESYSNTNTEKTTSSPS